MWRDHGHKKCRQSAPTGPIDLQLQSETIDGPYGQYRLNISAILTPSDRDFLAYFADGLSPIFTYYDPLGFPIGFDLSCLLRPRSVDFRTQQELEEAQSLLVETVRRLTMPCEIT
jgi:hypothetical protein